MITKFKEVKAKDLPQNVFVFLEKADRFVFLQSVLVDDEDHNNCRLNIKHGKKSSYIYTKNDTKFKFVSRYVVDAESGTINLVVDINQFINDYVVLVENIAKSKPDENLIKELIILQKRFKNMTKALNGTINAIVEEKEQNSL